MLPKNVIESIESLCKNFLWTGQFDKTGIAPVAWNDICLPRKEGGLGLKQLRAWNYAAMGKLPWRIHCRDDDIWFHWVNCKLKGRNIWQIVIPSDCAWSWRKLLQIRNVFRKYMQVQIGDGRECSLFYDHWFGEARLCDLIDCTPWQNYKEVQEWVQEGRWSVPHSFMRRFPLLAHNIQQVSLSLEADRFVWSKASSKCYSISSAYEAIRFKANPVPWRNIVWSPTLLPKQAFILCLLYRGRLKTREFLISRGMQINDTCGLCNAHLDSIEHIFFSCSISKPCWEALLQTAGVTKSASVWSHERRWVQRHASRRSRRAKLIRIRLATAVYNIWAERNGRVFRNESRSQPSLMNVMMNGIQMLESVIR